MSDPLPTTAAPAAIAADRTGEQRAADHRANTELLDAELPDARFVDARYLTWLYDQNPFGSGIYDNVGGTLTATFLGSKPIRQLLLFRLTV